MDGILESVRKTIGPESDYTHFDPELIMAINTAFFTLFELGVGPQDKPFTISDDTAKWSDFIDDGYADMVRSYVSMKVKLLFDPPASGTIVDLMKTQLAEFEWRLNVRVDPKTTFNGG